VHRPAPPAKDDADNVKKGRKERKLEGRVFLALDSPQTKRRFEPACAGLIEDHIF